MSSETNVMSLEEWVRAEWTGLVMCMDTEGVALFNWPPKEDLHRRYLEHFGEKKNYPTSLGRFTALAGRKDKNALRLAVMIEATRIHTVVKRIMGLPKGK
jgi:hypothetical protein